MWVFKGLEDDVRVCTLSRGGRTVGALRQVAWSDSCDGAQTRRASDGGGVLMRGLIRHPRRGQG